MSVFLVDHDDACGNAGAVKQVGRQSDDSLDEALAHEVAADLGFGVAAKQHAMRQDAGAFALALQRPDDVQQVGKVALLAGRCAKMFEALVRIIGGIEASAPALVGEGRIGDDVVERLDDIAFLEFWVGQRVALHHKRSRVVVQDHVHAGEAARCGVFFLTVERDGGLRLVGNFQQQRA